jgi:peptidoglycan/LPS O-acetylase OafA/YrhL
MQVAGDRPGMQDGALRQSSDISHRDVGLDAVRATAIWTVMISHGITNLPIPDPVRFDPIVSCTAIVGVEMFFALSGFLIGRILLDIQSVGFSGPLVGRFLARRWLRTLPVYYAFLAFAVLAWPVQLTSLPRFLVMAQDLAGAPVQPNEFPQSWSLPIEEFSYVLLPILCLVLARSRHAMSIAVSTLVLWSLVYRATYGGADSFMLLRTITAARLDAIAYGLLMAMVARRYGDAYRLHQSKIVTAALLVLLVHIPFFAHPASLNNIYGRVFALPLFSIAVSALLPSVSLERPARSPIGRLVRLTSDRAYTLYVVHIATAAAVNVVLHTLPLAIQAVVYVLTSYLTAGFLSAIIERPFMRLRPAQLPA